ncbi:TetR family transcriptional regulator [Agromyces luteolus]|uniref:TetR family transcriptional regulator n=1 Tax=Agromyces luteolus TaxID=88373 RepID=A0A7C9HTE3_9MICO|nr:TetR-like C-terminal domain-containing protein [Agromyces luteolus]MUN06605.1 TetR family transcriptional regulator [Agromyces luteolus]GLK29695.1 TetR family transcriptional regulator [Agromyces luteolus]
MPAPAKVTPDALRAAARAILEREGQQGLTMQAVAAELGVRAPSLYKHLRDRDALVRLVAEDVAVELGERMDRVLAAEADAADAVRAIAASARRYAREHPHGYGLIFGPLPESARARGSAMERSSVAILEAARRLSGDARALESARTITAWMHGFTSMELAGAFRLGGSVDDAWEYGLDHLVRGLAAHR